MASSSEHFVQTVHHHHAAYLILHRRPYSGSSSYRYVSALHGAQICGAGYSWTAKSFISLRFDPGLSFNHVSNTR